MFLGTRARWATPGEIDRVLVHGEVDKGGLYVRHCWPNRQRERPASRERGKDDLTGTCCHLRWS